MKFSGSLDKGSPLEKESGTLIEWYFKPWQGWSAIIIAILAYELQDCCKPVCKPVIRSSHPPGSVPPPPLELILSKNYLIAGKLFVKGKTSKSSKKSKPFAPWYKSL
jgi:hypothetical protein